MIKVCVIGLGKTGKEIARVLYEQKDIKIVSAVCRPESEKKGMDLGDVICEKQTGIIIGSSNNLNNIIFTSKPDIAVDFTNPEASLRNAKILSKMGVNILIGTTGFSPSNLNKLMQLAGENGNGILYAPNITTGVNVMMLLTNLASCILSEYDFQINEIHHKYKKDAPSATALKIAGEIEKGLKSVGMDVDIKDISINAVRAGGVVGRHEVMLVGEYDKIEISHESFSRKVFAFGAVKGIKFLKGKTGYFEMNDVLDLRKVLLKYIKGEGNLIRKKLISYTIDLNNDKDVINIK